MTIDYYYHWSSTPCKTVSMVIKHLNLKDINFILVDNLYNKQNPDQRLLKVNPLHQIPSIDDNEFHLAESCAIAQYLCDKYSPDNDLYPKDFQKRAQVNRMLFFAAGSFWPAMRAYVVPKFILSVEPPKEVVNQLKEKIILLNTLIGDKKYVAGDHLTIADFSLFASASYFDWLQMDLSETPNVSNWIKRIRNEHRYVNDVVAQFNDIEELKASLKQHPLFLAKTSVK